MDPASTEFRNTKDLIKTWAAEVNMPQELKLKMLEYIDESQGIIRQRYYGAPARAALAMHGGYSLSGADSTRRRLAAGWRPTRPRDGSFWSFWWLLCGFKRPF